MSSVDLFGHDLLGAQHVGSTARKLSDLSLLVEGKTDLILLARAELRDPYFPLHAAQELGAAAHLPPPPQYERAFPRVAQ